MIRGRKAAVLAAVCAISAGFANEAFAADSTFEMRKKVVSLLGILTTSSYDTQVTRAEFARMLVNASDYRSMRMCRAMGSMRLRFGLRRRMTG